MILVSYPLKSKTKQPTKEAHNTCQIIQYSSLVSSIKLKIQMQEQKQLDVLVMSFQPFQKQPDRLWAVPFDRMKKLWPIQLLNCNHYQKYY